MQHCGAGRGPPSAVTANSRPRVSGLNWLGYGPGLFSTQGWWRFEKLAFVLKENAFINKWLSLLNTRKNWSIDFTKSQKYFQEHRKVMYSHKNMFMKGTVDLSLVKLTYIFQQTGLWTRTGIILPNGNKRRDLLLSLFFTRISFLCVVSYFIMNNLSCHLGAY